MVVAIGGQRPGQEPGIAFGDEDSHRDKLVLMFTARVGLGGPGTT
jgi:hypothetical protein